MHILFIWWGILKETYRFENVEVYDNIQMGLKWGGLCVLYQSGSEQGRNVGFYEDGNELRFPQDGGHLLTS